MVWKPGSKRAGASFDQVSRRQKSLDLADLPEIGIAGSGGNGEEGRKLERDLARVQADRSEEDKGQEAIISLRFSN